MPGGALRSSGMGNCFKRSSTSSEQPLLLESENCVDSPVAPTATSCLQVPIRYHLAPNVVRTGCELTEDEQVRIAQRIGLIQNLPEGKYGDCEINTECVICMIDFVVGDLVRYLPCLHTYHVHCIDDWLMRRFTCPSCMEPVDTQGLMIGCET